LLAETTNEAQRELILALIKAEEAKTPLIGSGKTKEPDKCDMPSFGVANSHRGLQESL
jgi:hypothetical protein